ncbi:DUF3857 domain-containing protein [Pedobacter sp.]|uniref:DUF3857 domain-containing protein n=1 Tax=Pedobacter sp. TaxID=1411316 RepID=UPI003D7F33ED
MIKRLIFSLVLTGYACCVFAQQSAPALKTVKFGKVDLQEFETKIAGADSAARGVKLFDIGKCWFEVSSKTGSFVYTYERHVRYKVLNKSGYDLADYDVQLYRGSNDSQESLEFIEAATYNLENDKIIVSKLAKDARFTERQDKNWTIKKITLPNVKEGSIVEYRYKIKSDFIYNLRDWYFQSSIPTLYSEYHVRIPEYFRYKVTNNGFVPIFQIARENVSESYYVPSDKGSGETVQATALSLRYNAANIPAIKDENFITTMEDYVSKIEFELSSTQFPGSTYKDFSSTWPKIVNGLMEDEEFGRFFIKSNYSKSLLPSILKTETNPELQTLLIFDYVKNMVKWNERYGKYSSVSNVKTVLEKKTGNSADINLTLLSLLREAKIPASAVLVSTRENGAHPGHPLLTKFNNVIVAVDLDGKTILLDAVDKFLMPDLIAYQNLNHQGLKIDADTKNASWISLESLQRSKNNTYYNLVLTEDNKLSGDLYLSFNSYAGLKMRNKFSTATNEADYLKDYKKDKPGLEISNFKIDNLNDPKELLLQTMKVVIEDKVEEAGNLIMLSPILFEQTKENPFKLDERNFPVDFAYPLEESYRVLIEFPKNYKLEKLPANGKMMLPEDAASFTYLFSTEDNKVVISSKIIIGKSLYSADDYHSLKELFRNIIEKQAQQIVFKKI